MNLALFPPTGGGLGTLARSGQLSRLVEGYLPAYAAAFDEIHYFTYLNEAGRDQALPQNMAVHANLSGRSHRIYALTMPWQQAQWMRRCTVSRVFQATGILPAWLAKVRWGIPIVATYGYRYSAFARVEGRGAAAVYTAALERLALRVSDAIIVTTQELADYVEQWVPPERVHLIPNGVDLERFQPPARDQSRDARSLLFVGRLTPQKNLFTLLRAVARVQQQIPVQLRLIRDGALRGELEAEAQALYVDVRFHGTLPHADLAEHYRRTGAFVLASHIEGHPKVLIEAMACGAPVVVSDVPGNRSLVRHEVSGLLAPPDDPDALVGHIVTALTSPDLAATLGAEARRAIAAHYDLRALLQREVVLLHAVAENAQ